MNDGEIKIVLAARLMGVTPKTIYNWISDGTLKKVRPGYVLKSDLEYAASSKVQKRRAMSRRRASSEMKRDRLGRFITSGSRPIAVIKGLQF
jgi:predicted site-specific integrase-resolvase